MNNATNASQSPPLDSVPLHPIVGRLSLMAFADECNRNGGFMACAIPEGTRRGRMKWLRQYERQGGLCAICGEWRAPAGMTRDHIVPRAKGGGTDWDNIQLTCEPCNSAKGDKMPNERMRDGDQRPNAQSVKTATSL
jgi:hypothetical protein